MKKACGNCKNRSLYDNYSHYVCIKADTVKRVKSDNRACGKYVHAR